MNELLPPVPDPVDEQRKLSRALLAWVVVACVFAVAALAVGWSVAALWWIAVALTAAVLRRVGLDPTPVAARCFDCADGRHMACQGCACAAEVHAGVTR
jgi:hypothetical protein